MFGTMALFFKNNSAFMSSLCQMCQLCQRFLYVTTFVMEKVRTIGKRWHTWHIWHKLDITGVFELMAYQKTAENDRKRN